MRTIKLGVIFMLALLVLVGCAAGYQSFNDGKDLVRSGKIEEGLATLEKALKEDPKNVEYKTYYLRQKELYVNFLMAQGDAARINKRYEEAERFYRKALGYEPNHARAAMTLNNLTHDRRHDEQSARADKLLKAGKTDEAEAMVRNILAENPNHGDARQLMNKIESVTAEKQSSAKGLNAAFKKPITLEFRDANIKAIFEVISRATGINFIFDRDVRPDLRATIFVKNTSIEEAMNVLMVTNQLEKRVLNDNTVLIYPNTPAKVKDYQEQIVRAFYLANADVKQTLNMIKTLVKTRDIFVDEKLSMLVMRDTLDAIRLAEKLIVTHDRAEPEVMLEVEVLEVKRNRLLDLGIQYPNTFTALNIANQTTQSTTGGVVVSSTAQAQNIVTVRTLKNLTDANIAVSPNLGLNLRKEDGDAQILANPRIRVKNKEKAKIHIGEKVPVITTTSTANVGVSESVNYLDVGLKLDVEPQVYLDQEVGIKVNLEVSNIVREVRSQTGTLTYQVGTRNASTVLRLKDGETQVLAGLISDEDRQSASKIPGLGDLPLIGRLFSTHRDETSKTEIVLLITPHVVRNITRLEADKMEFTSGTEAAIGAPTLALTTALTTSPSGNVSAGAAANTAVPAAQNEALTLSMLTVPSVGKGKEFNVLLQANAREEIKNLRFMLTYDPARLKVLKATEAAFLKQGGSATTFTADTESANGRLNVDIKRAAGGARGTGAVLVLSMQAVSDQPGPAKLAIESVQAVNSSDKLVTPGASVPVSINITP